MKLRANFPILVYSYQRGVVAFMLVYLFAYLFCM